MSAFGTLNSGSAARIVKATAYAIAAHTGQKRKNGSDYYHHPLEASSLVHDAGGSEDTIVAAILHDTVEDTKVTREDIEREFGTAVRDLVEAVTNLPEWENLSKLARKDAQAEHIARESEGAKLVKMGDLISNMRGSLHPDAPTWWEDRQSFRDYIEGMRRVAWACRSVSPSLDVMFEGAYQAVYEMHCRN